MGAKSLPELSIISPSGKITNLNPPLMDMDECLKLRRRAWRTSFFHMVHSKGETVVGKKDEDKLIFKFSFLLRGKKKVEDYKNKK